MKSEREAPRQAWPSAKTARMTTSPELAMTAWSPGGRFAKPGQRDIERAHEFELLRRKISQRRHRRDCTDGHALQRRLTLSFVEHALGVGEGLSDKTRQPAEIAARMKRFMISSLVPKAVTTTLRLLSSPVQLNMRIADASEGMTIMTLWLLVRRREESLSKGRSILMCKPAAPVRAPAIGLAKPSEDHRDASNRNRVAGLPRLRP